MHQMSVDVSGHGLSSTPVASVVGEAVLRAEPDEAMVLVTLSALEDTPGPALDDVARRCGSLIAVLDELSILPPDRSTTGVTVQEDFDHTPRGTTIAGSSCVLDRRGPADRRRADRSTGHARDHRVGRTGRRAALADCPPESDPARGSARSRCRRAAQSASLRQLGSPDAVVGLCGLGRWWPSCVQRGGGERGAGQRGGAGERQGLSGGPARKLVAADRGRSDVGHVAGDAGCEPWP